MTDLDFDRIRASRRRRNDWFRPLTRLDYRRDHPAMNAIERAARALCKAEGNPENTKFEGKPMWQSYLPQVRLVLAAIQQADVAMIDAGNKGMRAAWAKRGLEAPAVAGDAAADEAWQAMIDVMLDSCG